MEFSYLNFKKFHPHVQNIMKEIACSTNKKQKQTKKVQNQKQTNKKVKKGKRGGHNSLLTHFICREDMISSMFTWAWDHEYRYGHNAMDILYTC